MHRLSGGGVEDLAVLEHPPEGHAPEPALPGRRERRAAGLRLVGGVLELLDEGLAPPPGLRAMGDGRRRRAAGRLPRARGVRRLPSPARAVGPAGHAAGRARVHRRGARARRGAPLPDSVDPQWQPASTMAVARNRPTVTVLDPSNPASLVLVAGGFDAAGNPLASAELYEPLGRVFAHTGTMTAARGGHTATLLAAAAAADVLVAGARARRAPRSRPPSATTPRPAPSPPTRP